MTANFSISYEYSKTMTGNAEEYIANDKYIVGYSTLASALYQRVYVRQINENCIMVMIATYKDSGVNTALLKLSLFLFFYIFVYSISNN